jgi:hypothetical protein
MKRILYTIILFLLGLSNSSAQSNEGTVGSKKTISDEMMKCAYIFEGKVISNHSYKVNVDRYITYTSYLVEVNKVVKGNIQKGTINILLRDVHSFDGHKVVPKEGLYCCFNDAPTKDTTVTTTNSKSLTYYCGDSMANGELKKDDNDNLIGYFPTIAEFYKYISANYGVKIEQ